MTTESPYREPRPPDPWLAAWDDLGRRRRRRWLAFWLWTPVVAFAGCTEGAFAHPGMAFAVGVVFLLHPHHFHCPRCGKLFEERGWRWLPLYLPFTRRCVHCRLAIGTPQDDRGADRGS